MPRWLREFRLLVLPIRIAEVIEREKGAAIQRRSADCLQTKWFRFVRAGAIGFSILFVVIAFWTTWIVYTKPIAMDFLSYWAASRLMLTGHVASVYALQAHHAAEELIAPISNGWLPFAYPPPFLMVVAPLGLAPFWLSFFAWIVVTAAIYARSVDRLGLLPYAMGQPSVLANFMIGQNGFLTTAILSGGLRVLDATPFRGGAILGLLVIKPQLALALPFAMIAGRQWRAIAGGALSATAALLVAFIALGWDAYQGFFSMLPRFANGMANNQWSWNELASIFALLRFLGVQQSAALVAQAIVALIAVALVCRAWWLGLEERSPMLAAATMLISPYVFTYDALLLTISILWLIQRQRHLWVIPLAWLLCFLPVATYFGFYPGPNTIPLAAILCLWALHKS